MIAIGPLGIKRFSPTGGVASSQTWDEQREKIIGFRRDAGRGARLWADGRRLLCVLDMRKVQMQDADRSRAYSTAALIARRRLVIIGIYFSH
jgi:hypothetical protein